MEILLLNKRAPITHEWTWSEDELKLAHACVGIPVDLDILAEVWGDQAWYGQM